jgi:hypothetical protein
MSKIEVNQISSQCGSTLTIGQSGDTVTLACGATQTGFGRTGTVDWCTTAKTAPFTGVSGKGYFVNTTCGAVTVTLPATPTAGDIISIKDYARTAGTNNIFLCRNGSKMDGICSSGSISTSGDSTTFIYVDGTQGWTSILDNTTNVYGAQYITATGGTITCCGNYRIHTFTSDGTFCVSCAGNPAGSDKVDYLVVAGGGGGGGFAGGGGGAGGFRTTYPSGCAGISVSVQAYPITVGAGGAGSGSGGPLTSTQKNQTNGADSIFSTITSTGGGLGGTNDSPAATTPGAITPGAKRADNGGSGGGGARKSDNFGVGNTPPTSPPQGNPGAGGNDTDPYAGGGGGGASCAGSGLVPTGGAGGAGTSNSITGSAVTYAGGGGGGVNGTDGGGGAGGAGGGGAGSASISTAGGNGTANTGGGGGSGGNASTVPCNSGGGSGGSGIVIIRYKFQ